jgi:hypothetical protein
LLLNKILDALRLGIVRFPFTSALTTTKGLSQIVTPDLQDAGDLSLSHAPFVATLVDVAGLIIYFSIAPGNHARRHAVAGAGDRRPGSGKK